MKKFALNTALILMASQTAFASNVSVVGTIPTVVETNVPQTINYSNISQKPNIILLQKVKLSENAKKAFAQRTSHIKNSTFKSLNSAIEPSLPETLDIGMNGTPVLNQGAHGSCVTFANSGALDALIGQGEYVSELCSLTLGNYLAKQDYDYPSGWDGSWGPIVLEQFFKYGIVSMENQKSIGCGGLKSYPLYDPSKTGKQMSIKKYAALSEAIDDKYNWQPIINIEDAFKSDYNPNKAIHDIKLELNNDNRVTFGVLLDVQYGSNGAVGSYHKHNDTWMLTPEIEQDAKDDNIEAGHEMIIIGYDDNAVVKSNNGVINKGLFILRNSWGKSAGDRGNYYMTYEHFKLMALEAQSLKIKVQNPTTV